LENILADKVPQNGKEKNACSLCSIKDSSKRGIRQRRGRSSKGVIRLKMKVLAAWRPNYLGAFTLGVRDSSVESPYTMLVI
jgi:hypothetical protein